MIEISSLEFSYDKKKIFEDFDLRIPKGKFVTIIGPNGCGKSTLLKLIAKELNLHQGKIKISSHDIDSLNPLELSKLLAFNRQQVNNIFPFSCLDYVMLGRRPYKSQFEDYHLEDLQLVEKYLKETMSYEFLEKKLNQVSGGELQRINLAKILTQETPIILLDESFSAMDLFYKVSSLDILRNKVKEGKSVVCVMHDLNLVYQYSDYVILLDQGKLIKSGLTEDVLDVDTIESVYKVKVEKIKNKGFFIIGG